MYYRASPYEISQFLNSDISLKAETDFEYIGENISEKYSFILVIWASKVFVKYSLSEKLLGITFDCKLKFNKYIEDIFQKASQKKSAHAWLAPYMGTTRKSIIMNTFFKSQFNYCPLVWMCCNRSLNTKINWLHERCLRIVYYDKKSNLLVKDGSVFIHHQNFKKRAVEMFKGF